MLDTIINATAKWNPKVIRESCDDYPELKPGDAVIEYDDLLALTYENNEFDIVYGDWLGTYRDPLPLLLMILNGYMEVQEVEGSDDVKLVVLDDDRIEDRFLKGDNGLDLSQTSLM